MLNVLTTPPTPVGVSGLTTLHQLLEAQPQLVLKFYEFGILLQQNTEQGSSEYLVDPQQVAEALAARMRLSTGLLSGHTLYLAREGSEQVVIEYRPRRKTALWLEGSEHPITLPLPELVLMRRSQGATVDYRLYAVKKRPTSLAEPLFQAPLPNVYGDGRICWGNVAKVSPTGLQSVPLTEDWQLFLGTRFTSHGVQGKSRRYPSDIRQQWLDLATQEARTYPKRDLCPTQQTLASVLEEWQR